MKTHLVSGGCGFVGRNMIKRLYTTTHDRIVCIDDLSTGIAPEQWIDIPITRQIKNVNLYGEEERLLFIKNDFIDVLRNLNRNPEWIFDTYGIAIERFSDVFHFAAIVGGRAMIDGDPIKVALDLAIDAEFFHWVSRHKPERVVYPSSSAAYPVSKQTELSAVQLHESDIDFAHIGQPDMTYGWTKLTGEFLAKITAKHYGVPVVCIRPFSGYGEDQDYSYPIPAIAKRAVYRESPFEVWGTGYQGRDFVHIDDILDCTLLAMHHISDGSAINIGTGKLTTFREVIAVFCHIAGYTTPVKCLPDKPVGVFSRYCNPDHVKTTLNWKPEITLEEGLRCVYHAVSQRENINLKIGA